MKTMKIKTKNDSLLHCFDLWLWLAVTGDTRKYEWPGWKENGGYLEKCSQHCPACAFSSPEDLMDCSDCVVKWPDGHCNVKESPFYQWYGSQTKRTRSKYALEIVILVLEALTGEED